MNSSVKQNLSLSGIIFAKTTGNEKKLSDSFEGVSAKVSSKQNNLFYNQVFFDTLVMLVVSMGGGILTGAAAQVSQYLGTSFLITPGIVMQVEGQAHFSVIYTRKKFPF